MVMWNRNSPAAGIKTGSQELWRLFALKPPQPQACACVGQLGVWCKTIQLTFLADWLKKEEASVKARSTSLRMCVRPEVAWSLSASVEDALSCRDNETESQSCHGNSNSGSGDSPVFMGRPVAVLASPQRPPPHSLHWSSGTQPHTGSYQCCLEWAWCRLSAAPRWSSGWIGPLMWWDWSPTPGDQTCLQVTIKYI